MVQNGHCNDYIASSVDVSDYKINFLKSLSDKGKRICFDLDTLAPDYTLSQVSKMLDVSEQEISRYANSLDIQFRPEENRLNPVFSNKTSNMSSESFESFMLGDYSCSSGGRIYKDGVKTEGSPEGRISYAGLAERYGEPKILTNRYRKFFVSAPNLDVIHGEFQRAEFHVETLSQYDSDIQEYLVVLRGFDNRTHTMRDKIDSFNKLAVRLGYEDGEWIGSRRKSEKEKRRLS